MYPAVSSADMNGIVCYLDYAIIARHWTRSSERPLKTRLFVQWLTSSGAVVASTVPSTFRLHKTPSNEGRERPLRCQKAECTPPRVPAEPVMHCYTGCCWVDALPSVTLTTQIGHHQLQITVRCHYSPPTPSTRLSQVTGLHITKCLITEDHIRWWMLNLLQ